MQEVSGSIPLGSTRSQNVLLAMIEVRGMPPKLVGEVSLTGFFRFL